MPDTLERSSKCTGCRLTYGWADLKYGRCFSCLANAYHKLHLKERNRKETSDDQG